MNSQNLGLNKLGDEVEFNFVEGFKVSLDTVFDHIGHFLITVL
jgi:hypothetical protein